MSRIVTFAATQLTISWDIEANMDKAEKAIRDAHAAGAQVILLRFAEVQVSRSGQAAGRQSLDREVFCTGC